MDQNKKIASKLAAVKIIKNLEERQIKGSYWDSSAECIAYILSIIPKGSSISWGGSVTLAESGILQGLHSNNYTLLDLKEAKSPQEKRAMFGKVSMSDYFLTSTNAITLDGELINIDGNGNRLACLLHGPENVIVVAGVNKIVSDIPSGYQRIKNLSAPANAQRLDRSTPCYATGQCHNCYSPDCMCSHTVITRRSSHKDRIQVLLIGEELGY